MRRHGILVVVLAALLGTGIANAYESQNNWDWTTGFGVVTDNAPDWWLDEDVDDYHMRQNWDTFTNTSDADVWVDDYGEEPDGYYWDFLPTGDEWQWSGEALAQGNVTSDGIRVPGNPDNWTFDLTLGNYHYAPFKRFYFEYELTGYSDDIDYFINGGGSVTSDLSAAYYDESGTQQSADVVLLNPGAEHWIVPDPSGTDDWITATWWGEYEIIPQPDWETIEWVLNDPSGLDDPSIQATYVSRVTAGSNCTPELPPSLLLGLGAISIAVLLRRRKS